MKIRGFVLLATLISLFAVSGHVFAQDDPPPPPLPTHLTPPGLGTPSAAAPPVVSVNDVTPPPPLPTHFTPTSNTHPTSASRPIITTVRILHRVSGSFKATRNLVRGEDARFVLTYRADHGNAGAATAELTVLKSGKAVHSQVMRKTATGVTLGSFRSDVRLASRAEVGKLTAFFRVTLGQSSQRSLSFSVQTSLRNKR